MSICLIGQQELLFPKPDPPPFLILLASLSLIENILGNLEAAYSLLELVQSDI